MSRVSAPAPQDSVAQVTGARPAAVARHDRAAGAFATEVLSWTASNDYPRAPLSEPAQARGEPAGRRSGAGSASQRPPLHANPLEGLAPVAERQPGRPEAPREHRRREPRLTCPAACIRTLPAVGADGRGARPEGAVARLLLADVVATLPCGGPRRGRRFGPAAATPTDRPAGRWSPSARRALEEAFWPRRARAALETNLRGRSGTPRGSRRAGPSPDVSYVPMSFAWGLRHPCFH
jgi:hypothetical protein